MMTLSPRRSDPSSLLVRLQRGCDEQDAIAVMEAHGFKCTRVSNGEFTSANVDRSIEQQTKQHTGLDFIRCNKSTGGGFSDSFVTTHTSVAIVLDHNSKVDYILANRQFVGL
jgi:hypothetical protein